jgi:uncharacterized phage protein gp47/JayE
MPFQRPTLKTLFAQGANDVAQSTGNFVLLRTAPLRILAKVFAGFVDGLYGYLDWIARQSNPATATGEFLRAWAALVGIYPIAASSAAGEEAVLFSGTPGAIMPEGTRLVRSADGVAFVTTALATVDAAGQLRASVQAVEPGAAGSTAQGVAMVIASAVAGVNATGSVVTAIAGGADIEDEDDFRTRMLERYRAPPQGGSATDYLAWAKTVPGVTRAWVSPNGAGAGTVVVYTMFDDVRAAQNGFPQGSSGGAAGETRTAPAAGDQLTVADAILPLQPVTALVFSCAPNPLPLALRITDLEGDSATLRAAITEAVRGMLRRTAAPGGTLYPSDITGAIASVAGIGHYTLVTPTAPVVAPAGSLATLNTITWS